MTSHFSTLLYHFSVCILQRPVLMINSLRICYNMQSIPNAQSMMYTFVVILYTCMNVPTSIIITTKLSNLIGYQLLISALIGQFNWTVRVMPK